MPGTISKKQTTTDRMNAMTWFFVAAEMHAPTARNAPAMRTLPT